MVLAVGAVIVLDLGRAIVVLSVIGLACISAIVYAWLAARRIDQIMESGGTHDSKNAE